MSYSVLHVASPVNGGIPRYVDELVRNQVARGWSVSVATPSEGELTELLAGSGAEVLPWEARREPGAAVPVEALRLQWLVKRTSPDVVHLHAAKAGLAGRLALRGRVPTIFQPQAWSFEAATGATRAAALAWERFAADWTDVVVCVSEAERRRGEELGIDATYRVVPNGVDLDAFPALSAADRLLARRRLDLNGSPLVVCVGRLCRQKGQDVLLDAWPSILEQVPQAELVLVGDGPDEERLAAVGADRVRLVGARRDVRDWLAAANVLVAPSRWEGMSIAMLEGMASARSIVATDVSGAREALRGTGAIVAPEAPGEIARALVERLLDPRMTDAEGREARRRAETSHDFRQTADTIAGLYAEALRWRSESFPLGTLAGRLGLARGNS